MTSPTMITFSVVAQEDYPIPDGRRLAVVSATNRDGAVAFEISAARCGACKHWRPSGSRIHQPELRCCTRLETPWKEGEVYAWETEQQATPVANEGVGAGFFTRAEFGCALFEPKPATPAPLTCSSCKLWGAETTRDPRGLRPCALPDNRARTLHTKPEYGCLWHDPKEDGTS